MRERIARMMIGRNGNDQLNRFQQVLEKNGVIALLREAGVRDGDTVEIYGFSFDFYY